MSFFQFNIADVASYLGSYSNHFAIFGAVSFCFIALKVGRTVLSVAVRSVRRSFAVDLKQYGRWAVITGSTDGIGKSYALQLAEKGMDVVLISRNPQKLSSVAEEIGRKCKVQVKVVVADFKKTDIYEGLKEQLSGLDIGILVNNVGMVNSRSPSYHCETENFEQYNRDVINVNVLSCVMMTGIVLPEMLERKRGTIINLASGASLRPLPFYSIYSATKSFIKFFSEALNIEYASHGVTIQVVIPNLVVSNMSRDVAKASNIAQGLWYPSSDHFVRCAIRTIGREPSTGPYWAHELQQYAVNIPSDSVMRAIMLQGRNKMIELAKKE